METVPSHFHVKFIANVILNKRLTHIHFLKADFH